MLGFDIRSDDPVPAWSVRSGIAGCCWCSTIAHTSSRLPPALVAAILRGAADVHILATSREPLRVEAEHVQRLPPLSSGSPSDRFGAAEALAFPAIELCCRAHGRVPGRI